MQLQDKNYSIPIYMQELLTASGQGLDALSRNLSEVLSLPILVTTAVFDVISSSFSSQDVDQVKVEFTSPREENISLFDCSINANAISTRAVGHVIAPTGRIIGYLFVLIGEHQLDKSFIKSVMDYAASLTAVHLQSRMELKRERYKLKNAFLYDLLYGNIKISEEVISTGEIWDWDFRTPHAILLFVLIDFDINTSDKHLMDVLLNIVERAAIDLNNKNPALMVKRNELILFTRLHENLFGNPKQYLSHLVNTVLTQFSETEITEQVICGIGQIYTDPTDLFRSYQEAKVACEMGKLLEIPIPFFGELGLERILYKHDLQDLREYYSTVLGELHRQDDPEGSYIKLLECFAYNHFDINKTADVLYMHRNTVRYQLKKIEDILGRDLRDCYARLDIIAALKIKRLHNLDQEF